MRFVSILVSLFATVPYLGLTQATPTPTEDSVDLRQRDSILNVLNDLNSVASGVVSGDVVNNILEDLKLVTATAAPTSPQQAISTLSNILQATPTPSNIYAAVGNIVAAGLTSDNVDSVLGYVDGLLTGDNSETNVNLLIPSKPVYPRADKRDAPYSLPEAKLRGAIHIPPSFQYGRPGAPQPIILVPGTGNTGYINFVGNYIPLLQGSKIADPVWLNIPGYLLNDVQTNAEYVAYAMSYIYGISRQRKIAVLTWSQGGIDAQWATKYWPSTRSKITDIVAFSPDYHGTILANFIATPDIPLPPSLLQQEYNSNLIKTLRSSGGDSAYVPTTTIYSGFFDEIVEPQQGTGASAYLLDARHVGVTNNEVQKICPGQPAGSFYTHEGILYNPIGYALLVDALSHNGPGQVSRIDLSSICGEYLTPGLDLSDLLLTENTILVAVVAILLYPNSITQEPAIKGMSNYFEFEWVETDDSVQHMLGCLDDMHGLPTRQIRAG